MTWKIKFWFDATNQPLMSFKQIPHVDPYHLNVQATGESLPNSPRAVPAAAVGVSSTPAWNNCSDRTGSVKTGERTETMTSNLRTKTIVTFFQMRIHDSNETNLPRGAHLISNHIRTIRCGQTSTHQSWRRFLALWLSSCLFGILEAGLSGKSVSPA